MIEIIIGVISLTLGSGFTFLIISKVNANKSNIIIDDAKNQAEQIRKEKILQAKEKFLELKAHHETTINRKNNDINKAHQRVSQKENTLNQKLAEVNKKEASFKKSILDFDLQKSILEKKQVELEIINDR